MLNWILSFKSGGEGGIRTHGDPKATTVFETAPFGRSGTSPADRNYTSELNKFQNIGLVGIINRWQAGFFQLPAKSGFGIFLGMDQDDLAEAVT